MIKKLNGDLCHEILSANVERKLGFNPNIDYSTWVKDVRNKFEELFGLKKIVQNNCPLKLEVEEVTEHNRFKQIRFTFESERGAVVPCYLLIPYGNKEKYAVAIALQGHISGFHNSSRLIPLKKFIFLQGTKITVGSLKYQKIIIGVMTLFGKI